MPVVDGFETARRITSAHPDVVEQIDERGDVEARDRRLCRTTLRSACWASGVVTRRSQLLQTSAAELQAKIASLDKKIKTHRA